MPQPSGWGFFVFGATRPGSSPSCLPAVSCRPSASFLFPPKDKTMKPKQIDAVQVCKEFEDLLAPRLKLSALERAIYCHLFRHTRLVGKSRLRFSILWLANHMGVKGRSVRTAVRRLIHEGALRLIERSNLGHLVEVRLPGEVCVQRASRTGAAAYAKPLVNLD